MQLSQVFIIFLKFTFNDGEKNIIIAGSALYENTIQTPKMHSEVSAKLNAGDQYFACFNRHVINADPVFLAVQCHVTPIIY